MRSYDERTLTITLPVGTWAALRGAARARARWERRRAERRGITIGVNLDERRAELLEEAASTIDAGFGEMGVEF